MKAVLIDQVQTLLQNCCTTSNAWVTAGASTPEFLVQEVVDYCQQLGAEKIQQLTVVDEDVKFHLPAELTVLHSDT